MITINFLGDDRVRSATGKLFLYGYVASLAAFFLCFFLMYNSTSNSITKLTAEQEQLEQRLNVLKKTTKEVRNLEDMQRELRNKLAVIGALKKSKQGPVRVLDDLNMALPEKAWITEISEKVGVLSVSGFALDNPTIAQFLRDLDASEYFEDVELGETKNAERDMITIKAFTITSTVNYTGLAAPTPTPEPAPVAPTSGAKVRKPAAGGDE